MCPVSNPGQWKVLGEVHQNNTSIWQHCSRNSFSFSSFGLKDFLSQRCQPYKQHDFFFSPTMKSLAQHNDVSLQSGSCSNIISQRTQRHFDSLQLLIRSFLKENAFQVCFLKCFKTNCLEFIMEIFFFLYGEELGGHKLSLRMTTGRQQSPLEH